MSPIMSKAMAIKMKCIDINIEVYFPVFTENTLGISSLFA